jgi:hypothetical protein
MLTRSRKEPMSTREAPSQDSPVSTVPDGQLTAKNLSLEEFADEVHAFLER